MQGMVKRRLTAHLKELLSRFPAVVLLGPRQVGKTTLAKSLKGNYFDLEEPRDRLRLDVEWEQLAAKRLLLVLDEAQNAPEVFSRLRSAIDQVRRRHGRFLLLGSVSPALMTQVGESLAGRLAICELTPLLLKELSATKAEALWRLGGYPDGGILRKGQYPRWQSYYLELMAQRDLPNWGLPARALTTSRLFRMLAALHSRPWNASQVGKSLGLSYHTVNSYVDFLEYAFLIRRLPAFSANIKKRLVKSPKIYWRDSGLLHALLGVESGDDLLNKPWVGASWEGWAIGQILDHLKTSGKSYRAYHLRTNDQQEIDLVLEYAGRLWALETKLTSVPARSDLQRLKATAAAVKADRFILVSRTSQPVTGKRESSLNLSSTIDLLLSE
jgi:predicted AAA+ superfamily ATPase